MGWQNRVYRRPLTIALCPAAGVIVFAGRRAHDAGYGISALSRPCKTYALRRSGMNASACIGTTFCLYFLNTVDAQIKT